MLHLARWLVRHLNDPALIIWLAQPALRARLDVVRDRSHNIGYGVGEDMDALLAEHEGDD